MSDTINEIEGEIASQKVFSSILLGKLRDKYAGKPALPRDDEIPDSGGDSKASSGKVKDPKKLAAIQQELQQIAQPGEVQSAEGDKPHVGKSDHGKDPNYEGNQNGEEFHPGEVLEGGNLVEEKHNQLSPMESVIAVLVFVCNRPTVKRNLDQLFKYRPSAAKFPIIVSQDCGSHPATTSVIKSYGDKLTHIMVLKMALNVTLLFVCENLMCIFYLFFPATRFK